MTVLWDGEALLAANSGEVWRLDPETGDEIWHNRLQGLGRGLVSLASTRAPAQATGASTRILLATALLLALFVATNMVSPPRGAERMPAAGLSSPPHAPRTALGRSR